MTNFVEMLQRVQDGVNEIKAIRHDDEVAHSNEDNLHAEVLQWIAEYGDGPSAELAKTALQTIEISFSRWLA